MMPNLVLTLRNGLDRPIPINLHISAISQEGKTPCLVNLHSDACDSLRYINTSLEDPGTFSRCTLLPTFY